MKTQQKKNKMIRGGHNFLHYKFRLATLTKVFRKQEGTFLTFFFFPFKWGGSVCETGNELKCLSDISCQKAL